MIWRKVAGGETSSIRRLPAYFETPEFYISNEKSGTRLLTLNGLVTWLNGMHGKHWALIQINLIYSININQASLLLYLDIEDTAAVVILQ